MRLLLRWEGELSVADAPRARKRNSALGAVGLPHPREKETSSHQEHATGPGASGVARSIAIGVSNVAGTVAALEEIGGWRTILSEFA